ncbi:helix-turn-helix domain-containing protein [Pararhizobium sp.]|uniref:helix-turn-helix domain-containing protein n=1 Tax=Pararhizobium sp. TaxID=1977563 RepID=UPI003D0DF86A
MTAVDQDLIPLGEAVRRLRKVRGLTQEDLSGLTELHRNHVGGIERGERNITIKTVLALAQALEVRPAELLAGYPLRIDGAKRD